MVGLSFADDGTIPFVFRVHAVRGILGLQGKPAAGRICMAILSVSNLQVVPGIQFQLRTIGNKIEPDAGRRAVCCRGRFPRRGMRAEAAIDPTRDAKLWERRVWIPFPDLSHRTEIKRCPGNRRIFAIWQKVDHIHILLQYPPNDSIKRIFSILRQESTYHVWQTYAAFLGNYYWTEHTLWSDGYFAASVCLIRDHSGKYRQSGLIKTPLKWRRFLIKLMKVPAGSGDKSVRGRVIVSEMLYNRRSPSATSDLHRLFRGRRKNRTRKQM